ncbi:spore germination protein [Ammoniphilus sp. CFH 90114]|uniref:spore germination protein n=1 Tax=Ammoniphilus sp. CFH 90114 TaxID=2493665 RepID=UPI00100F2F41|nr:spore germination protein [Ammoniphilus sp. CFH 90114]RXT04904.1 spore germination protein [Ammoniphilus sp. CFH 90114]
MYWKSKALYEALWDEFHLSKDAVFQTSKNMHHEIQLVYFKSLTDETKIQAIIFKPFYELDGDDGFSRYIRSLPNTSAFRETDDLRKKIIEGNLVLFCGQQIYILDVKKAVNNTVRESTIETVIQGPQFGFSENVEVNLNLIRHRYRQSTLMVETQVLEIDIPETVYILYDSQYVNRDRLQEIKNRLSQIKGKSLQAVGELEQRLNKQKITLFPTSMITERPDRVALNLAQGKVVLMINGTPFVLLAPAVFYDFMSSMEDIYQSWGVSRFIIALRYLGLSISLVLPSLYVGVTSFNPELFQVQLALSIAGSRVGVPYPSYLEVLFMLIMMELLTEASIRLPKTIGSTATTVGGLILGQAATEAGLVSNIMIILVAAVAISNFVIPINAMGFSLRVSKYFVLLLTTWYGLVGLMAGMLLLFGYLCKLDSFGQPYLRLFLGSNDKDLLNEKENAS